VNNIRREASRHLRNKKRQYLKDKTNELLTNRANKNIRDLYRGIYEFKMAYQYRGNLVKDKNGALIANSHNILKRWKKYVSQLFDVHRVSHVRQTEIYTAESLVTDPIILWLKLLLQS
jgi:hypothetical protein